MKRIPGVFMVICIMLSMAACGPKTPTWQEQYDLGMRYLSEGNYEEAIIAFTAAIEIDPKQAPAYVGRGNAYIGLGETEENLAAAQIDYEKAIELDDTCTEAYLALSDVYARRGDYDNALNILQEGNEKTGKNGVIEKKIKEIENSGSNGENTNPVDITVGYWTTNGYRLGDTCVYRFQPDGTFLMQMGVFTTPTQGKYEYIGQTINIFMRDEIDDILNYDAEKQIFISSQKMVVAEQGSWYPDGFKSTSETLSFLKAAPVGFFEEDIVPSTNVENLDVTLGEEQNIKDLINKKDSSISAYLKETVKQYIRNMQDNKELHFMEDAEKTIELYGLSDFNYYIEGRQIILYFEAGKLTHGTDIPITIPTGLFLGQESTTDLAQLLTLNESDGLWMWFDDEFSPSRGMDLLVGDFHFERDLTVRMTYGYYCSEGLGSATGTYIVTGDILIIDLVDDMTDDSHHYEFQIEPIGDSIAFTQISEEGPFYFYTVGTVLILQPGTTFMDLMN